MRTVIELRKARESKPGIKQEPTEGRNSPLTHLSASLSLAQGHAVPCQVGPGVRPRSAQTVGHLLRIQKLGEAHPG